MKCKRFLEWTPSLPRSVFVNTNAGSLVQEGRLSLEESTALSGKEWEGFVLVTPEWVEEKWSE